MTGIHRFNERGMWKDQFQFVGLQMPYEMPFDVLRKLKSLGGELLRAILSETALPCLVCGKDVRKRMEFGNCHQFYP